MHITDTTEQFRRHMKAAGYADSTVSVYSYWLCEFEKYLEKCGIDDLRKVTRRDILNYREKVITEPLSASTVTLKLRPVKRLFEYLEQSRRILISPAEGLPEIRGAGKRIGTVLTPDEMKRLLSQADMSTDTSVRNRAVMELMYSAGIRVGELVSLEVSDPDFDTRVLRIRRGKGNVQRIVPLGTSALRHLKMYLQEVRPVSVQKKPDEKHLFLNESGTGVSTSWGTH
ncbi:MAG: tyrosine-type recombinase/integrase [Desulfobacteraceae bacterium]|nr:tyrosine-type recombinase/integrase [Desulfobacteraceae bacterium]